MVILLLLGNPGNPVLALFLLGIVFLGLLVRELAVGAFLWNKWKDVRLALKKEGLKLCLISELQYGFKSGPYIGRYPCIFGNKFYVRYQEISLAEVKDYINCLDLKSIKQLE